MATPSEKMIPSKQLNTEKESTVMEISSNAGSMEENMEEIEEEEQTIEIIEEEEESEEEDTHSSRHPKLAERFVSNFKVNERFTGHCLNVKEDHIFRYRLTPLMVTYFDDRLSVIDLQNLIEMGLQIVRFRNTQVTTESRMNLIHVIKQAQQWICDKYDVSTWPVALCVDIPNCMIKTGHISKEIKSSKVEMKLGDIVQITCDENFAHNCNSEVIYIDDPYTFPTLKLGTELTMCQGPTTYVVTEEIDSKNVKCKVVQAGILHKEEIVSIRGIKYKKPILQKIDKDIMTFAKENEIEIVCCYGVRYASTLHSLREFNGKDYRPLVMSILSVEEGLESLDAIIEASDGIILARDYLYYQMRNVYQLANIQMQVCSKCQKAGKPVFLGGNVMDAALMDGVVSAGDLSDITNGVIQGAGFIFRHYREAHNVVFAMKTFNSTCINVEQLQPEADFWKAIDEIRSPVNAAEATAISCAMLARQTHAQVIIVPTVSGRTATQLARLSPPAVIIAITRNMVTAYQMPMYKGIYTIVYDKPPEEDWFAELSARITFALRYCRRNSFFVNNPTYVLLCKSSPYSCYSDCVSVWQTEVSGDIEGMNCPETAY